MSEELLAVMYETHSWISTLLWEENGGACGGDTHSRTGRSSTLVTRALSELCNHNINKSSAVHATRCMVWPVAKTV